MIGSHHLHHLDDLLKKSPPASLGAKCGWERTTGKIGPAAYASGRDH
jgi:hypothetical protein